MSVYRQPANSAGRLLRQARGPYGPRRLSHIGSRPLEIPPSVDVTLHNDTPGAGTYLRLSGPLGTREICLPPQITPAVHTQFAPVLTGSDQTASPTSPKALVMSCSEANEADYSSQWGLASALVANALQGVSTGFSVSIKLVGVGYRAAVESETATNASSPADHQQSFLVLRLGYPRPVRVAIPQGITCLVSSPTDVALKGQDKQSLGELAARIRRLRPPEPYNGKGVFVDGEQIVRKEVKKK